MLTLKGGNNVTFANTVDFTLSNITLLSTVSLGNNLFPKLQSFSVSNCPVCISISFGDSSCALMKSSISLNNLDNLKKFTIGSNSFKFLHLCDLSGVPKLKISEFQVLANLCKSNKSTIVLDSTFDLVEAFVIKDSTYKVGIRSIDDVINKTSPIYVTYLEWSSKYDSKLFNQISWNQLEYLQTLIIEDNACSEITSFQLSSMKKLNLIVFGESAFSAVTGKELMLTMLPSLQTVEFGKNCFLHFASLVITGLLCFVLFLEYRFTETEYDQV